MDLNINSTTPNEISQNILDFCAEIGPPNSPFFVSVRHVKDVRFNYCLTGNDSCNKCNTEISAKIYAKGFKSE